MFDLPSNDSRAEWASHALDTFQRITRTDREDAVSDLLGNLMHYCHLNGLDFLVELNRGAGHFQAEIEIEASEEAGEEADPSKVADTPHHYIRLDGYAPRPIIEGLTHG